MSSEATNRACAKQDTCTKLHAELHNVCIVTCLGADTRQHLGPATLALTLVSTDSGWTDTNNFETATLRVALKAAASPNTPPARGRLERARPFIFAAASPWLLIVVGAGCCVVARWRIGLGADLALAAMLCCVAGGRSCVSTQISLLLLGWLGVELPIWRWRWAIVGLRRRPWLAVSSVIFCEILSPRW